MSRPRDFYHSCYCLSGLSVAQWGCYFSSPKRPLVYGDIDNLLVRQGMCLEGVWRLCVDGPGLCMLWGVCRV
jgi:prenyltransferase beta subunit